MPNAAAWVVAGFTAFTASMRLDDEPAAPHHTIDNRLDAASTLQAQVSALVRSLAGGLYRPARLRRAQPDVR